MTTRREFLKTAGSAAAGIVFTGCPLLDAAHAQSGALPKRREVMVGGKRIKTIDVHAHCAIPEAMALHGDKFNGQTRGQAQQVIVIEERLGAMNAQGIDMEALSINPTWYKLDRDLADKVVQLQNEKLAELCGKYPDRFVAFASLALQHPDLAIQQLEYTGERHERRPLHSRHLQILNEQADLVKRTLGNGFSDDRAPNLGLAVDPVRQTSPLSHIQTAALPLQQRSSPEQPFFPLLLQGRMQVGISRDCPHISIIHGEHVATRVEEALHRFG